MAMRYGYFDSEITGVDSEGMPIFDRAETSELFRLLFSKLLTSLNSQFMEYPPCT